MDAYILSTEIEYRAEVMNLVMTEHLRIVVISQLSKGDDWETGFRRGQRILNKSFRKPDKELSSQLSIVKLLSKDSQTVIAAKTTVAESQESRPF